MLCVWSHSWSTDDHRARVCDSTTVSQVLMCDVCQDLFVVRPETPVPWLYSHKIVSLVEAEQRGSALLLNIIQDHLCTRVFSLRGCDRKACDPAPCGPATRLHVIHTISPGLRGRLRGWWGERFRDYAACHVHKIRRNGVVLLNHFSVANVYCIESFCVRPPR